MKLEIKKIGTKISEYAVFIALILLVAAMTVFADGFATGANLLNLLRQATFNGLIAFGMTLVILSDGIDLSVGSVFALSAIICAELIMSGMTFLGISGNVTYIIKGAVILVACILDMRKYMTKK